jgi:hypothetical protein
MSKPEVFETRRKAGSGNKIAEIESDFSSLRVSTVLSP